MLLDPLDLEERWENKDNVVFKDNKVNKEDPVFKDLQEDVEIRDQEVSLVSQVFLVLQERLVQTVDQGHQDLPETADNVDQ